MPTLTFSKVQEIPAEYQHLITKDVLGEDFYQEATHKYIYGSENPIGVIAYTLDTVGGKTMPRFIHVSIETPYRASENVSDFLLMCEDYLRKEGYYQTFAVIPLNKLYMQKTALRYGFKEWYKDDESIYFYKDII